MQKLIFTKTLGLNFHQLTINPQPSKALKFNRQLSKWFKNNRQPSKLPHPTYTSKNGGKTPGFGTQLQGSGGGGTPLYTPYGYVPPHPLQAAGSIFGGLRRSASQSSHISEGRGAKSIVLNQGLYYIKRP